MSNSKQSDTTAAAQETIERPSHFIGSQQCAFGRTTMLPGYVVSSVGEYTPTVYIGDRSPKGWVKIGCDRLYETFVFEWVGKRCETPGCGRVPLLTSYSEIGSLGANTRAECEANHAALVEKYAAIAKAEGK